MALTNVREFNLRISEHPDRVDERHAEITKAVAVRALTDVTLGTRFDTGRARGNWQVQEGAPPEGFDAAAYDPIGRGIEGGSARDPIEEGTDVILESTGRDIIWIHNGVPYIGVLERLDKMLVGTVSALRTWLGSIR